MDTLVLQQIQRYCDDPQLYKVQTLQKLWSNYGEIARYYSPKCDKNIIVKHIKPPSKVNHPRGWHSDVGHQRKVDSYRIEADFYQYYAVFCYDDCYVPDYIALIKDTVHTEQQTLLMEDLTSSGFCLTFHTASDEQVKIVLHWLAHFHGRFLQMTTPELWPVGSYWYLTTRQAEYNAMPAGLLKDSAQQIDKALGSARFKTLLHGDAKLANFCFSDDGRVAAVDFQYVGRGAGIKDVMYFLGSCLAEQQLWAKHDEYIDYYFAQLKNVLLQGNVTKTGEDNVNADNGSKHAIEAPEPDNTVWIDELEQEWRTLLPLAWADFNRFLQGWSPGHVKINDFMQAQTTLALTG
ncbi:phosphotransferase [Paraglaciecola sp. 20A4]|uniref:phosphotransferase n=1 Tax=Paraglaciecola sp. 20A4 TaxID=2687288 RepID=UPI001408392F|nr:phosphotransferase [Paraglaciecola sp. 20A4]